MKTPTATRLLRFGNGGAASTAPAAPTAFDPVNLPFSVVFEARSGRRLDTNGSPASLPGDPVAVWQSRASGGLQAAQSTFAARPVYQTVGGKSVLRFTADDYLTVPTASDAPGFGDALTVVACVEAQAAGGFQVMASVGSSSVLGAWFLAFDGMGRVGLGAFGAGFCVYTTGVWAGSGTHTIVARKNGAFLSLRVDGQELGVAVAGTTLTARRGPLTIGAAQDIGLNFSGDVRFFAAAPNTCLSNAECANVEAYCAVL